MRPSENHKEPNKVTNNEKLRRPSSVQISIPVCSFEGEDDRYRLLVLGEIGNFIFGFGGGKPKRINIDSIKSIIRIWIRVWGTPINWVFLTFADEIMLAKNDKWHFFFRLSAESIDQNILVSDGRKKETQNNRGLFNLMHHFNLIIII